MSIKKVADIAGVSIATVSRYFNNPNIVKKETLDKVESAIKAINYQPNTLAQNFRRGKSGIVVVVVHNIGDPLYENLTRTITRTAQLKGYDILIKETNHNQLPLEYYRDMLSSKQVDGLIVMVDLPKMDTQSQAILQDLPIVLVKGETPSSNSSDHIGFDNYEAGKAATNYLLKLGHTNIACITPTGKNTAYTRRLDGFSSCMKGKQAHIFSVSPLEPSLEAIMSQLLQLPSRPTALFCLDDDLAIDALHIAKQNNVNVPKDLSIIGFNNIRYSTSTVPPLTTIEQPVAEIAQHSIEVLCAKIESSDCKPKAKNTLKHRLIVRSSTCPPAK